VYTQRLTCVYTHRRDMYILAHIYVCICVMHTYILGMQRQDLMGCIRMTDGMSMHVYMNLTDGICMHVYMTYMYMYKHACVHVYTHV